MMKDLISVEDLTNEAHSVQAHLDEPIPNDIERVLEVGSELSALISRTGEMISDAEYHRDAFKQSEIMAILKDKAKSALPPSILKEFLNAACKDYNHLCKWCDRLNATATHQLDWCRTLVSNAKSERDASMGIGNTSRR